jgi:shikimate kinase/3-dehydroquinate synthase
VPEGPTRIVLVGFMGAGKTTVGRLLAARLGYDFEDMDARIEARTGRPIAALFAERGEEGFREVERHEAGLLAGLERRVIAAGGGAFVQASTRALLEEGAVTVWLRCGLETLLARIPADGTRPLAGNHAIMQALLAEREPSYRLADLAVDTSRSTPREVADQIAHLVGRRAAGETARRR